MTDSSQPVIRTTDANERAKPDPAFPFVMDANWQHAYHGLSKREYFAVMAMQSIRTVNPACTSQEIAQSAVADADALLKELAK